MRALISLLLVLGLSQAFAINRLGVPISSSRWDENLPDATHPGFPSDLGALPDGRLSLGMQNLDLGNLSISLPGFQIISANTRWAADNDTAIYKFAPDSVQLFRNDTDGGIVRYRGYFEIAGGLSLSSLASEPRDWDVGVGFALETQQLFDESEKTMLWGYRDIGGGVSLRYKQYSAAGYWNNREFKYRLGYVRPMDWQLGLLVYQNPEVENAVGGQIGGQKYFHQCLRVKAAYNIQYVGQIMTQKKLMLGMALRFRPWREGVDPLWTRSFMSPFGGENGKGRYLFDWELSGDFAVDQSVGNSSSAVTISRWF
jgi:hypothetical protein